MDPITLAILGGMAGSAAGTLPSLLPTKFEREEKRRMKELQAKEAAGMLGLSEQQKSLMERQLQGGVQAAAMGAEAERNRLLAGGGAASGGQALLGAQLADEERQRAQERVSTEIMAADIQRKREQELELRNLEAARGQIQEKAQAAAGAILGAGVEAGLTTGAQERLFAGARAPSQESVQALSTALGVSPDVARGYIELSVTNPEMFKYLSIVKGGQ